MSGTTSVGSAVPAFASKLHDPSVLDISALIESNVSSQGRDRLGNGAEAQPRSTTTFPPDARWTPDRSTSFE